MNIEDRINKYIIEAKKVILNAGIKKKTNTAIRNLTTPKNKTAYFDKIPLQPVFDILKKFDIITLQEDNTPWDGFLTGRSATIDFDIAPISSKDENNRYTPYTNATLRFQWYKMPSGRYEITSYIG